MGLPAQCIQAAAVHQLAGGAVEFAGVEVNFARVADGFADGQGQFLDGDVFTKADVDVALHGAGVLRVGGSGQVHHENAGSRHVVYIQKLAPGRAAAPDGDGGCFGYFGFMKSADQGGDDMAVFGVVVVARAVQVGGHDAAVVHAVAGAVLTVVALTQLDAGDLGYGVGLVGGLQRAVEQGALCHGLRGELGVDAAGAQEQEPLHAVPESRVNHVGLHHQVLVDELGRVGVVGVDAAYFGGGHVNLGGLFLGKEGLHGGLVGEV